MSSASLSDELRRDLGDALRECRERTLALVAPLDEEDLARQARSYLSPPVWDLGHIASFEELWLVRKLREGRGRSEGSLDELYNPFEVPREARGDLPLPSPDDARAYLRAVRDQALERLASVELDSSDALLDAGFVYNMALQHESQHQETLLQSIALHERQDRRALEARTAAPSAPPVDDEERVFVPAGAAGIGTDDRSRAYDNERPWHAVELGDFSIDRYPVTARRWAGFVDDGGYRRPDLWSEAGWAWREEHDAMAPAGWRRTGGDAGVWRLRRFGSEVDLSPAEPVQHVSWWEAEAFARWAGGRLPTEAEWEKAAGWDPEAGCARTYPWGEEPPTPERVNLGGLRWGPDPVGSHPRGASAYGAEQMLGDVYQWTASDFDGYPGFEAFPYREYSEVFFREGYRVLRGASWAASRWMARNTYRNWDLPERRQVFAGLRLAWDPV